jgi:hypothetical protein
MMGAKKKSDGVVGYFLHTFHENGDINWQGRIVDREGDNHFLVQLYSWLSGFETNCTLISKDVIADYRKCCLYKDPEEWAYQGGVEDKRSSDRREKEKPSAG